MAGCGVRRGRFSDQVAVGKLVQLTWTLFCMGALVAAYDCENEILFVYFTKLRLVGFFEFIG